MCESSIYLLTDGEERLILENVDIIEILGDKIRIVDIFGEEMELKAKKNFLYWNIEYL
jgi:predicted RNA-binding protein